MKNFFIRIYMLFDLLSPFAGIVFYFTDIRIGLYICAVYGILFAIQRIPRGDLWSIIFVVADIIIAAIVASFTSLEMLPLAAVFICGNDSISYIIGLPAFISSLVYCFLPWDK